MTVLPRLRPATFGPLALLLAILAAVLSLPACATDGQFTIFGYSTKPNYDCNIKSVRVQIFKNKTPWTVTPVPGMEMELTKSIIREIEQKTPFKVKQDADTELSGAIISFTKGILNANQFNYPRETETVLTCEVLWTDLRTGEVLSRAARRFGDDRLRDPRAPILAVPDVPIKNRPITPLAPPSLSSDASAARNVKPDLLIEETPEDEERKKRPKPIVLRSVAYFRPEFGESITTAMQMNYDRMATLITQNMEKPW